MQLSPSRCPQDSDLRRPQWHKAVQMRINHFPPKLRTPEFFLPYLISTCVLKEVSFPLRLPLGYSSSYRGWAWGYKIILCSNSLRRVPRKNHQSRWKCIRRVQMGFAAGRENISIRHRKMMTTEPKIPSTQRSPSMQCEQNHVQGTMARMLFYHSPIQKGFQFGRIFSSTNPTLLGKCHSAWIFIALPLTQTPGVSGSKLRSRETKTRQVLEKQFATVGSHMR